MKIICDRAELAEAARWVSRAIMKVPFSPVMAGMIFETTDHEVMLRASDFDLSLMAYVDCEIIERGAVLVPGHAVAAYLGAARGDEVIMEGDDRLTIKIAKSQAKYATMPFSEYPRPLPESDDTTLKIDGAVFADMVRGLLAHSDHDAKPLWQQGIRLQAIGGTLGVSCGTRYAQGQTSMPAEGESSILLLAEHLDGLLPGLSGELLIKSNLAAGPVTFRTATRVAQLRQLDEEYPDVDQLYETQRSGILKINRGALVSAVRLASTGTNRVVFHIRQNGPLMITSFAPEKGELLGVIDDEVEADASHDKIICLNSGYVLNALAGLTSDEVLINYETGERRGSVVLTDGGPTRHLVASVDMSKKGE